MAPVVKHGFAADENPFAHQPAKKFPAAFGKLAPEQLGFTKPLRPVRNERAM
jgi:hypothetical protein